MRNLGKRIVVVGVSASGKSIFTRKLSAATGLPAIYMDALMWKPGWNYIGDEETLKKLREVSEGSEWIIEGYITTAARTFLFEKADTIIYLDYSPLVASWRYIKRWWKHKKHARPELEGSPDTFSFKFLGLVWTKGEGVFLNEHLSKVPNQEKIVRLHSPKAARRLLEEIGTIEI